MYIISKYKSYSELANYGPKKVLEEMAYDMVNFVTDYERSEKMMKEKSKDNPVLLKMLEKCGDIHKSAALAFEGYDLCLDLTVSRWKDKTDVGPLEELSAKMVKNAMLMSQASNSGYVKIDRQIPGEVAGAHYQIVPTIKSRDGLRSWMENLSKEVMGYAKLYE